jgi:LysR family transcriptional regulator (chromosome initiation inhibitor)
MLDYSSLAAVATVVREGSFEHAARALNVTPSAVSQRVKQLEERLGCVLIIRGHPCRASAAGRLLCRHIERVSMLEHDLGLDLPMAARTDAGEGRVSLRIAVNADSLGTWFLGAMTTFIEEEAALFDVALDEEEHTAEWLRNSEVLAAVTSVSEAVPGCDCTYLGRLFYTAVASPDFMRRYFSTGVNAASLELAPCLTFNRKDKLQQQWMHRRCRHRIDAPVHWLPSTQAFIDATVAGIAWGMNPVSLVQAQLRAGTLVELIPGSMLAVPLYWQNARLPVPMLQRLTQTVIAAARSSLKDLTEDAPAGTHAQTDDA